MPLFRRSGPATKGLHAPWIPKEEVAEGAGYANAVLLFALNARALCSDLKFGSSPEPPLPETAVRRGRACPARSPAIAAPLTCASEGGVLTPPRGVEDAAPYILGREPSANRRGGLPPSLAPLVRHPSTPPRRGRACPARSLASAPGFVLHPLYLLHRREGLRGCEQGPRLSGAKPGCEQCLPLRGKQPHERVCEANWRRSLCAAKR